MRRKYREELVAPEIGSRWHDHELGIDVVYAGDSGHGPKWRKRDGDWYYCDWYDLYLWQRFEKR